MFEFEANEAVIIEQKRALESALSTNPKTVQALRKVIREQIMVARAKVVSGIHFKNGDPRGAAHAVRTAVYKKVLGANINIYNSKKAHGSNNYEPPRTLQPGQRGGNRRLRSMETERYMRYEARDRGFILRWVNSGTGNRDTKYGKRGAIAPRNFFKGSAERQMVQAADNIANIIEEELAKILTPKQ